MKKVKIPKFNTKTRNSIRINSNNIKISLDSPNMFWKKIITKIDLINKKNGGTYRIWKKNIFGVSIPRPEKANLLRWSLGEPKGQIADWRASFLNREEGFHALEYKNYYECHIDRINPHKNLPGHLIQDSPHLLLIAGIGIGLAGLYYFLKD